MIDAESPKAFKPLADDVKARIAEKIRQLLHASRDCMRNQGRDTTQISFNINDAYYGEAFGMLHTLQILGYGNAVGPINIDSPGNLRFWFDKIERQVLAEENFGGSNECDHCLNKYRKDAVRKRPW